MIPYLRYLKKCLVNVKKARDVPYVAQCNAIPYTVSITRYGRLGHRASLEIINS